MSFAVRRVSGFTLIEVVVVLLLMGIITVLVVANVAPDDKKQVRIESERLASLFEQASIDARVSGAPINCFVTTSGYRFETQTQDGDWLAMDDDIYRPHPLPAGVNIQAVAINQVSLPAGDPLLFRASGINPPFVVIMAKQQARMLISGDPMNRVTVEADNLGP